MPLDFFPDSANNESMRESHDLTGMSTKWVESLALEELDRDESGVVHMDDHFDPTHLLEESSIELVDRLREYFDLYAAKFNEFRGRRNSGSEIKIFKISNTVNDFMLFRGGLRLVFARKGHDVVNIGLVSNGKDLFGPRQSEGEAFGSSPVHEIKAHLGAFNQITWRFEGEEFDINIMARYYFSEFVRISAT